jgi:enterochelin esterase-like enzyme
MHALAALVAGVLLPGFTQLATGPRGGEVLTGALPGEQRAALVYLPPGFVATHRYPVAYLLHGLTGSPSEYPSGAGLLDFADGSIADGKTRPFIAVMPAAGSTAHYDGEWAGPWETNLVDRVVPWVDAHLPTVATAAGRTIAGLSAGGFGAVNIAVRHPGLFGTIESWSGYFHPLRDGPFKGASRAVLAANDPFVTARSAAPALRRGRVRFFLSTGPHHSHFFQPTQTLELARELRTLGVTAQYRYYASARGQYRTQLSDGLTWALAL